MRATRTTAARALARSASSSSPSGSRASSRASTDEELEDESRVWITWDQPYKRMELGSAVQSSMCVCADACRDAAPRVIGSSSSFDFAVALHERDRDGIIVLLYAQNPAGLARRRRRPVLPDKVIWCPMRRTRVSVSTSQRSLGAAAESHRFTVRITISARFWSLRRRSQKVVLAFDSETVRERWVDTFLEMGAASALDRAIHSDDDRSSPGASPQPRESRPARPATGTARSGGAATRESSDTNALASNAPTASRPQNTERVFPHYITAFRYRLRVVYQMLVLALVVANDARQGPHQDSVVTPWQAVMFRDMSSLSCAMILATLTTLVTACQKGRCAPHLVKWPFSVVWLLIGLALADDAGRNDIFQGNFVLAAIKMCVLLCSLRAILQSRRPTSTLADLCPPEWAVRLPVALGVMLHLVYSVSVWLVGFGPSRSGSSFWWFASGTWENVLVLGIVLLGPGKGLHELLMSRRFPRRIASVETPLWRIFGVEQASFQSRDRPIPEHFTLLAVHRLGLDLAAFRLLVRVPSASASPLNMLSTTLAASVALLETSLHPFMVATARQRPEEAVEAAPVILRAGTLSVFLALCMSTGLVGEPGLAAAGWTRVWASAIGYAVCLVYGARRFRQMRSSCLGWWLPLFHVLNNLDLLPTLGAVVRGTAETFAVETVLLLGGLYLDKFVFARRSGNLTRSGRANASDQIRRHRGLFRLLWKVIELLSQLPLLDYPLFAIWTGLFVWLESTQAWAILRIPVLALGVFSLCCGNFLRSGRDPPRFFVAHIIQALQSTVQETLFAFAIGAFVVFGLVSVPILRSWAFWPLLLFVQLTFLLARAKSANARASNTRATSASTSASMTNTRSTRAYLRSRRERSERALRPSWLRGGPAQNRAERDSVGRTRIFQADSDPVVDPPQDPCCICLETYEEKEVVAETLCGHYFHAACIDKCKTNVCPMCRQQAFNGSKMNCFRVTKSSFQGEGDGVSVGLA